MRNWYTLSRNLKVGFENLPQQHYLQHYLHYLLTSFRMTVHYTFFEVSAFKKFASFEIGLCYFLKNSSFDIERHYFLHLVEYIIFEECIFWPYVDYNELTVTQKDVKKSICRCKVDFWWILIILKNCKHFEVIYFQIQTSRERGNFY